MNNNNNNNDKLNEAFYNIDSKYIENTKTAPKKSKNRTLILSIAAIITLLAVMLTPVLMLMQDPITSPTTLLTSTETSNNTETVITEYNPNYTPPRFENAKFSISEIEALGIIPGTYGGTQNYKKIYHDNLEYLYLDEIEYGDTTDIYEIDYLCGEIDKEEFIEFINRQKINIEKKFGTELKTKDDAKIEERKEFWGGQDITVHLTTEYYFIKNGIEHKVTFVQDGAEHRISIRLASNYLEIENIAIELRESMTDEDILKSVKTASSAISSVFSFEAKEITISRDSFARVYLYDSIGSDFNSEIRSRVSNCIRILISYEGINYDKYKDYKNYITVTYSEFRIDPSNYIKKTDSVKMLSLEMAEELLENGYCFGGHTCRKCMQNHALVDFSEYDYLGIEYLYGEDYLQDGDPKPVIPFYIFYKKMDETDFDGKVLYAKTYVPAIEISGLKEYFDNLRVHK